MKFPTPYLSQNESKQIVFFIIIIIYLFMYCHFFFI